MKLRKNVPICDIWLDEAKHGCGGLVYANEDTIVDLEEAEEL